MTQKALLQGAGDGTAVPQGYVGQVLTASPGSNVTPAASGNLVNITSITLTPGVWLLTGKINWANGVTAPTSFTGVYGGLSTNTSTFDSKYNFSVSPATSNSGQTVAITLPWLINITSNTIYYLNGAAVYSALNGAVWNTDCILQAVRIA